MEKPLDGLIQQIAHVILGKEDKIRLSICCLLARGHLLIEDLPGVGKTTLAHTIAKTIGLDYQRIQFTSDLLPSDILGVSIYNRETSDFRFHPGPIFANLILADEINRATPKAQSALLEAMEERQVTVEGETRPLPEPFFVIATQNPSVQIGTFPLPESQLDRFLMRLHLGYPDARAERALLSGEDPRQLLLQMKAQMQPSQFIQLQAAVKKIQLSAPLLDYLQAIINQSRLTPSFQCGLSPRAGLGIVQCAKAWAFMEGRTFVIPEDIKAILPATMLHRVLPMQEIVRQQDFDALMHSFLQTIPIP